MALIAIFSYLFGIFVVYQAVGEKNSTVITEVYIESRCEGITGFKSVDIIWKPLHHKDFSDLTTCTYTVSYCTSGPSCVGHYQFGCTLNTCHSSQNELLKCSMIAKDLFPFQFYFKVEIQTSNGVHFISKRKACRLLTNTRCTVPEKVTVTATGKKTLSVTWKPPLFMGELASYLCFKILYAPTQAKKNETLEISSDNESELFQTISDLAPYTAYTIYIQCGFAGCVEGWGMFSRPVTVRTNEEAPAKAPEFTNCSFSKTSSDLTVLWKLPPSISWNGVPNGFNLDIWRMSLGKNGSLTPLPNSSRHIHIVDGNATEARLNGLSVFGYYQTQISMCTAEGCGPSSEPYPCPGEEMPGALPTPEPSHGSVLILVGSIVGPIVFVAIVAGLVFAWNYWQNRQSREQQQPLEQILRLPDPLYGNQEDSSSGRSHSYDEIPLQAPGDHTYDSLHILQDSGDLDNSRHC